MSQRQPACWLKDTRGVRIHFNLLPQDCSFYRGGLASEQKRTCTVFTPIKGLIVHSKIVKIHFNLLLLMIYTFERASNVWPLSYELLTSELWTRDLWTMNPWSISFEATTVWRNLICGSHWTEITDYCGYITSDNRKFSNVPVSNKNGAACTRKHC